MARESAPAFQFYPKDFLTDSHVFSMTLPERGAYITLLCLCWMEQSLPVETDALARLCRVSAMTFARLWPALEPCFTVVDGRLVQPRMERERRKQETWRAMKVEAGQKGGKAKAAAKQKASRPLAEASPPSSSSSSSPIFVSKKEKDASLSPAALSDPKRDPFTDADTTERAGRFLERYQELYPKHRKGALYALKPVRDYAAAVTLCHTWPDERLDKLAVIFLTTDHKFAEEGSRTVPQFLALASWCDGRLADHESKKGSAA